jgi:hypothetical protein
MKNLTPAQIKQAVLDQVFDSCTNDADYLANLIEWAHRDYKNEDYENDFIAMELSERQDASSYT